MGIQEKELLPAVPGTPFGGGFYAGRILIAGVLHALIVAPKAEGEHEGSAWNESRTRIVGADSYSDGMQNTVAMATGGSTLALWARALRIGGYDDWYLPSQDELEILYRHLKPTTESNSLYARSGINISAAPATLPYSAEVPAQTTATAFMEGGEQAFSDDWYWSSTQHAADASYAWGQSFVNGDQDDDIKSVSLRARAVRRFAI
jgi:hypothetical protein